jgi:hypothetical protein
MRLASFFAKTQVVVNIVVLALLLAIAWAFFRLPNRDVLMLGRQQAAEAAVKELKAALAELEARQQTIEAVTLEDVLKPFRAEIQAFSNNYNNVLSRLDRIEKDLDDIAKTDAERLNGSDSVKDSVKKVEAIQFAPDTELKRIADNIPDGIQIGSYNSDEFIDAAFKIGLVPKQSSDSEREIVGNVIRQHYELFRANRSILQIRRRLQMEELIGQMNKEGKYVEVSLSAPQSEVQSKVGSLGDKPSMIFQRSFEDLGIQRIYSFSYDVNPELAEYQDQVENARLQMIKDIYEYGQSLKSKQQ